MFGQTSEPILLKRETKATQIPSGYTVVLPAGARVILTQSLGGTYTVMTDDGQLVRINDEDVDALGVEKAEGAAAKGTQPEGPFEEAKVWEELKTVYDPEIPVNIVDLGLVYVCEWAEHPEGGQKVTIRMTMTAPGCGMGGVLMEDVKRKVASLPGVREVDVNVVWDPPWDQSRMSEAARLQLGFM